MITSKLYGYTKQGLEVTKYILTNNNEYEVHLLSYGLTIQKILYPASKSTKQDIVLGYDTIEEYEKHSYYMGCIVGRNANRLSNGTIVINNEEIQLTQNESTKQLHGGVKGFDKQNWDCKIVDNKIEATYISPHLEEGFPGALTTKITFELTGDNELLINTLATTTQPTVVNLTRHDYFNLKDAGKTTVKSHQIQIRGAQYTPTDSENLVTGELNSVKDTPYDLREFTVLGERLQENKDELPMGFDTNYVVNTGGDLITVAEVIEPTSNRKLEILSTQPGIQFYTAAYVENNLGKNGTVYQPYHGFCLETQHFPDATKHLHFESTIITQEIPYTQNLIYKFTN